MHFVGTVCVTVDDAKKPVSKPSSQDKHLALHVLHIMHILILLTNVSLDLWTCHASVLLVCIQEQIWSIRDDWSLQSTSHTMSVTSPECRQHDIKLHGLWQLKQLKQLLKKFSTVGYAACFRIFCQYTDIMLSISLYSLYKYIIFMNYLILTQAHSPPVRDHLACKTYINQCAALCAATLKQELQSSFSKPTLAHFPHAHNFLSFNIHVSHMSIYCIQVSAQCAELKASKLLHCRSSKSQFSSLSLFESKSFMQPKVPYLTKLLKSGLPDAMQRDKLGWQSRIATKSIRAKPSFKLRPLHMPVDLRVSRLQNLCILDYILLDKCKGFDNIPQLLLVLFEHLHHHASHIKMW